MNSMKPIASHQWWSRYPPSEPKIVQEGENLLQLLLTSLLPSLLGSFYAQLLQESRIAIAWVQVISVDSIAIKLLHDAGLLSWNSVIPCQFKSCVWIFNPTQRRLVVFRTGYWTTVVRMIGA